MEERITQKKLQSLHTQKLLREAITQVIAEKGIDSFTVNDICKAANVAVGTFYKYYKCKEEVISDRYKQIDAYFLDEVAPCLTDPDETENLVCFARMYFAYCTKTPLAVGRQVLRARLSGVSNQVATSRQRPFFVLLDGIFTRGQARGVLRNDRSAQQLSDQFMILMRGYSFYQCVYGAAVPPPQEIEAQMRLWCSAFSRTQGTSDCYKSTSLPPQK